MINSSPGILDRSKRTESDALESLPPAGDSAKFRTEKDPNFFLLVSEKILLKFY